ncbi:MAG: methylmalonyl-CoA epimerase [Actinobacteria bacterium]|nr:methylmalonyl-CoA epimerase [Actinomycetota bacterium]
MHLERIDHVGYAVTDLEEAIAYHRDLYDLTVVHRERVERDGVAEALLSVGESYIQLLEPLSDASPVARFMQRTGGPGIHHVGYGVRDVAAVLDELKQQGIRLVDDHPRRGSRGCTIAFLHPKSAMGVLIELVEDPTLGSHAATLDA